MVAWDQRHRPDSTGGYVVKEWGLVAVKLRLIPKHQNKELPSPPTEAEKLQELKQARCEDIKETRRGLNPGPSGKYTSKL